VRISVEWVREYVDLPDADLAHELTLHTVEVEEVVGAAGDTVLEIDNKSLTNRPDLWGHHGIARELAAIFERPLGSPAPASRAPRIGGLVGDVDPGVARRLTIVEFELDGRPETPARVRDRLARVGAPPAAHACVDLSNYVMYAVGQPTHVYDADRVTAPLSVTRLGEPRSMELLTGRTPALDGDTPVVADATGPIGVAGVLGGAGSAVIPQSRRFLLEAATFRPEVIRRASVRLGLRTEASTRFEKGLDTQRVDAAVDLYLDLLAGAAPGVSVRGVHTVELEPTRPIAVEIDTDFLCRRIGRSLEIDEVRRILGSLGFQVDGGPTRLRVTVPTWRATGDVSSPHDLVEEVARLHGYDRLTASPPTVVLRPPARRPLDRRIREQLATRAGLREVITYPWVTDRLLAATGIDAGTTVRIASPPAPDRASLRPSLVPNLLETVAANLRHAPSFGLFEVGTVFQVDPGAEDVPEPLPPQPQMAAVALVGPDGPLLFRQARGVVDLLRRHCHLEDLGLVDEGAAPWADPDVRLGLAAGPTAVGTLALLSSRSRRLAGIEGVHVALFELALDQLSTYPSRENRYRPVPDLPPAEFDLSVVVADGTRWREIAETVAPVGEVSYVDEFRGAWVPAGHVSITLRVTLRPTAATLTADEISAARRGALAALEGRLGARLRDRVAAG